MNAVAPFVNLALVILIFFFFNDTATTEIYTLSLHDALPICQRATCAMMCAAAPKPYRPSFLPSPAMRRDRKSTRLNSSHLVISYAVFCLKKKNRQTASSTYYYPYKTTRLYHAILLRMHVQHI